MSDPVDRITNIFRAELAGNVDFFVAAEIAERAAERVATELQLTEECGFHHPDDPIDEPSGWCAAADYEGMTPRPVSHRRWVTPWSEVQP